MDAETSLDAWIAHNWQDTPRPPWPRATFKAFYEEQLAYQATVRVKSAEQQEIAALRAECQALRRRVKDLELMAGTPSRPGKPGEGGAITDALGMALAEIRKDIEQKSREEWLKRDAEIAALRGEIDNVRDTQLKYGDIWSAGREYPPNTQVTHRGSLWLSLKATSEPPTTPADWRLICKQGSITNRDPP